MFDKFNNKIITKYRCIFILFVNLNERGMVKMKTNKKVSIVSYGISFFVFLIIALSGKFLLKDGDEIGYILMSFYLIMPITSLVSGIVLGIKNAYLKWAYPVTFGALGIIIPSFIFKNSWDWISLFFSLIPALTGLIIGVLINKSKGKKTFL